MAVLKEIRDNKTVDPQVRLKAAETILDRGFGKPATTSIIRSEPTGHVDIIEGQLADARQHTNAVEEIAEWAGRGIPVTFWPEHVRKAAGVELGVDDFGAGPEGAPMPKLPAPQT